MTKPVFIIAKLYPHISKLYKNTKIKVKNFKPIKTLCRNTVLLPLFLGKTFKVHNGRLFLRVLISENIIGHKLGEFSQSRRRYIYKKGKQKQKK